MSEQVFSHKPVLLDECIEALAIRPEGVYLDGTLGRAGHSREIAARLTTGRLICVDRDQAALDAAEERLAPWRERVTLVHSNFCALDAILDGLGLDGVDGMLFDLGVSSPQLDDASRGFSYRTDAPLDMRMDQTDTLTARAVVNEWPQEELRRILWQYGEERYAPAVAGAIVRARDKRPIETTLELVELIKGAMPAAALDASLWKLGDGSIFAVPAFSLPKVSWTAAAAIMPIAIATIPESTAHMYQLDIYVNDVARKKGSKKKYDLVGLLDRNLIGDGICDMISGVVGGPAGTNYGENISTMAITKVFSVPVLAVAAVIAMIVSFFTPLIQVIYGIPQGVIGGLEVYLFGAIAAQGVAIMIEKKVDMFSSKNIAVIASIMIIGLGGQYQFGGNIPFFGLQVPCIAGAAIFGIALNLLLSIGEKRKKTQE